MRDDPLKSTASGQLTAATPTSADEVGRICAELIRFDTTNRGEGVAHPERPAAEYVAGLLDEVGVRSTIVESAPGRASVLARVPGTDPSAPAFLIHGHLDVVPADPAEWAVPPFSGEVRDGCVWGRGAVDMKGSLAMTLATVRRRLREGRRTRGDLVLAFLADEECTGDFGSRYVAREHRAFFEGCTEAISESGGFSVDAGGTRIYPIATGERGTMWMRLTARGTAGHGSKPAPDNAVAELAHAVSRLAAHTWPVRLTSGVRALLDGLADALGTTIDHDRLDAEAARLGGVGRLFTGTIRNSANPTRLAAGYKVNVVPGTATAEVDGRYLPGTGAEFLATVDRLLGPKVTREFINYEEAPIADPAGPTFAALADSLRAEDPLARPVPYVMAGGTDAKAFHDIGITSFGFAPLLLGPDLDYLGMFHGVDERVPLDALAFGTRVLDRFLDTR
ncbi:acetylornithine deacetylase/succinyl-diaminopimelate desuccinylase-like protein [Actinomadura pelletieri DSM 43383]|uniref:Acetylornithine deacetylase/succinyl-diaminopimelate desuccinylase-like protein n=1 Tax=Actinomadura pelletieri DSM 43383 TaxID=1120940 RepID=A0A495Q9H9_9ACTN|nr:M20/M25/M40 family metallo-hydrolase [Actinomadura pelletieri]RKS67774.1 acetylornithine deacetylase/succinyl-diaminopimelate desuccinylase-like protein [Actinomadura pelletieri DSM 43383]